MADDPPPAAPVRLVSIAGFWWRIDADAPADWTWEPFAEPRHRFDSAARRVRVRYAARVPAGAFRERYRDTGAFIPVEHARHHLVRLAGRVRVLNLRSERVLDALGLDDRVSTGHETEVWAAAQTLTDRCLQWWGSRIDGIVYRPRTTPATSANLAFFPWALSSATSQPLTSVRDLLDELVVAHGFTVAF